MNIYSLITFIVNKVKNLDKLIGKIMHLIVFIVIVIFILIVIAMFRYDSIAIANDFITLHN